MACIIDRVPGKLSSSKELYHNATNISLSGFLELISASPQPSCLWQPSSLKTLVTLTDFVQKQAARVCSISQYTFLDCFK